MKIKFLFDLFLSLVALILFAQGLALYELIPVHAVSLVIGVGSTSVVDFFLYPFLFFILRFLYLGARTLLSANSKNVPELIQSGASFWSFMTDFFRWVMAFWFSLVATGLMVGSGLIPNQDPPLFFVILNFYLAFFIYFFVLRRIMDGDYFDKTQRIFSSALDSSPETISAQSSVTLVRKFFSLLLTILCTLFFLGVFFLSTFLIS
ncbi:MAG: hypothetical protein WC845_00655 [Candidatus Staskawiczbacteria bacterium]